MGYQLHSDQLAHKIAGVSQSKGARLVWENYCNLPMCVVYMYMLARVCVCVHVCVHARMSVHKYVCSVFVCVCVHVCVCAVSNHS